MPPQAGVNHLSGLGDTSRPEPAALEAKSIPDGQRRLREGVEEKSYKSGRWCRQLPTNFVLPAWEVTLPVRGSLARDLYRYRTRFWMKRLEEATVLLFNLKSHEEDSRAWELLLLSRSLLGHALFRIALVSLIVSGSILWIHSPLHRPAEASTKIKAAPMVAAPARIPSSNLPKVSETNDVDEILKSYTPYLEFVLDAGKKSNPRVAKQLDQTFQQLRKRDRKKAATFLVGLRMEILHHLSLTGKTGKNISSNDPNMRKWVGKYLYDWYREADEQMLRAVTKAY